ncbi:hypothetical protein ABVN23_28145 [Pseudomonas fluorescens]|uniref:hypothetical protein n=1 Tax=Pseudomonas fluorescens TaxID=294 RepID=UPI003F959254
MSAIHDSAMNNVYHQVLTRLLSFFSRAERTALQLLIQRLLVAAGGPDRIGHYKVLVSHSGSRDSCYTLAFMRAAQLSIAGRSPATFQMRVATLRLGATTPTMMESIHRSYNALFVYDDPRVEVLMVDHREVLPFAHPTPISDAGRELNRRNLLLLGHLRTPGSIYEVGDEGYLAMGDFYAQMVRWEGGVDALVGGETARQQRQFIAGLLRGARKAGLSAMPVPTQSFEGLFDILDELQEDLFRELYAGHDQVEWRPHSGFDARRGTLHIDIQDLVTGNMEERWPLLTEFLGLQPDERDLQMRENDFASPLLSAHFHGLQAAYLYGHTYERGFTHYVQHALLLMRRRGVPERFCQQALALYGEPRDVAELRVQANIEAQQVLGLSEAQQVCLLFAPFAHGGAGLERFLRRCHPGMLVAQLDLHKALQGQAAPEPVAQWIVDVSGLPLAQVRSLYARDPIDAGEPIPSQEAAPARSDSPVPTERSARR